MRKLYRALGMFLAANSLSDFGSIEARAEGYASLIEFFAESDPRLAEYLSSLAREHHAPVGRHG
jgi:hypothetical protein